MIWYITSSTEAHWKKGVIDDWPDLLNSWNTGKKKNLKFRFGVSGEFVFFMIYYKFFFDEYILNSQHSESKNNLDIWPCHWLKQRWALPVPIQAMCKLSNQIQLVHFFQKHPVKKYNQIIIMWWFKVNIITIINHSSKGK